VTGQDRNRSSSSSKPPCAGVQWPVASWNSRGGIKKDSKRE